MGSAGYINQSEEAEPTGGDDDDHFDSEMHGGLYLDKGLGVDEDACELGELMTADDDDVHGIYVVDDSMSSPISPAV